jgi:pyruvate,water dikinase
MDASSPVVVPLAGIGSAHPDLVGGKARGFAVIARAGLPAPHGFVVTTAAYRAAAADSGRMPAAVARQVTSLVAAMGDAPLAVRSSATGEDGDEHSHAGQYLTRLGVRGPDAVLDAIHACWASADGEHAEAYRNHRGHHDGVEMAVLVQRLAGGEAAGVCMSRDPVTGDPDTIVVNAAYGLGELVVSGLVTPDDYRLSRADGALIRFEPGFKDLMLVMGDDRLVEVPVPPERREARVLDDPALGAVRDGLLRCERELGQPADCEFSIVDSRVIWLQCRPMTALGDPEPVRQGGTTV